MEMFLLHGNCSGEKKTRISLKNGLPGDTQSGRKNCFDENLLRSIKRGSGSKGRRSGQRTVIFSPEKGVGEVLSERKVQPLEKGGGRV